MASDRPLTDKGGPRRCWNTRREATVEAHRPWWFPPYGLLVDGQDSARRSAYIAGSIVQQYRHGVYNARDIQGRNRYLRVSVYGDGIEPGEVGGEAKDLYFSVVTLADSQRVRRGSPMALTSSAVHSRGRAHDKTDHRNRRRYRRRAQAARRSVLSPCPHWCDGNHFLQWTDEDRTHFGNQVLVPLQLEEMKIKFGEEPPKHDRFWLLGKALQRARQRGYLRVRMADELAIHLGCHRWRSGVTIG